MSVIWSAAVRVHTWWYSEINVRVVALLLSHAGDQAGTLSMAKAGLRLQWVVLNAHAIIAAGRLAAEKPIEAESAVC